MKKTLCLFTLFFFVSAICFSSTGIATEVNADNVTYSKSLPVLFINTVDNAPIVSKEDYVDATYYLETFGLNGYEAIGSEEEQFPLEIRGRGNASWANSDKKPYKLKLASKESLMGMNKSKHFVLLAEVGGYTQFLTETAGMEMGKMIGLIWTPEIRPVEVVLNGDYIGLYLLTENVRVAEGRVDIYEQPDESINPEEITGGWLVEIDNYDDPFQIKVDSKSGYTIRITHKSPEVLSLPQMEYLEEQIILLDKAICDEDSTSTDWEKWIDIDYLVRYYIVQEILDNADAFHGSTYMYKEQGTDQKWIFGPLWDLGYSFWREKDHFIYEESNYSHLVWIKEIARYPNFQKKVREIWQEFYMQRYNEIYDFIDKLGEQCEQADAADALRWPQYNKGGTISKCATLKSLLKKNTDWLDSQWGVSASTREALSSDRKVGIICGKGIISIETDKSISDISLYDLSSIQLPVQNISDKSISISVRQGIYIVEISFSDGDIYRTCCWIK